VSVVVLMLAILMLIAIPSFLGAKEQTNRRAAQSSLRIAFTNAKSIYAEHDDYTNANATALGASEPELEFTAGVSSGPEIVSVEPGATTLKLAVRTSSGACLALGDDPEGIGVVFANLGAVTCRAADVPALPSARPTNVTTSPGSGWATAW
jgi:type IV pilus assembly protein PilA